MIAWARGLMKMLRCSHQWKIVRIQWDGTTDVECVKCGRQKEVGL